MLDSLDFVLMNSCLGLVAACRDAAAAFISCELLHQQLFLMLRS